MCKIPNHIIEALNNLSCENVAEELGIEVVKHRALCFMHDDHHPSLYFSGKNREMWWCFVCNKGGKAINLVMEYACFGFVEACQWLGSRFNINVGTNNTLNLKNKPINRKKRIFNNDAKPFSKDIAQWILDNSNLTDKGCQFLFKERKLQPRIIEQLHIVSIDDSQSLIERLSKTFDTEALENSGLVAKRYDKLYFRMFTPCLLFPYYNESGMLIGLQSRYLGRNNEAPRFQFVSAQKTRVFNMPIINSMGYGDELYISEGITDCLALLSAGKNAVAIPSATILPLYDLANLVMFNLHMYPDQDDAGKKAYAALRRFFVNHYAILYEERLPKGVKDYSEYYMMSYGKE